MHMDEDDTTAEQPARMAQEKDRIVECRIKTNAREAKNLSRAEPPLKGLPLLVDLSISIEDLVDFAGGWLKHSYVGIQCSWWDDNLPLLPGSRYEV